MSASTAATGPAPVGAAPVGHGPRAGTANRPATPVLLASLLLPTWIIASLLTGTSPWAPFVLTGAFLVLDRVLGLERRDLPIRLCLLFGYGLMGIAVQLLVAPTASAVFYQDEATYDLAARGLAEGLPASRFELDTGWPLIMAGLYRLLGSSLVLARFVNAVFGVLFIGLLIEIAGGLQSRRGTARHLYWLAGASPALLVWVLGGIRDLGIGLGATLVAAALMTGRRRVLRFTSGAALAAFLAPTVMWVLAAFVVGVVAMRAIESGRLERLAGLAAATGLALAVYGPRWAERLSAQYFRPATRALIASNLESGSTITSSLQTNLPFAIAAPVVVVFAPVWFAMLASPSTQSILQALGALGWWMLLPAIAIGFARSWSDPRTRPLQLWALGGLALAAVGLITVVQDPARLRVVSLGAFFLLAWRAIDLAPSRVAVWTRRWVVAQVAVAGLYWLARAGFPVLDRLGV